MAAASLTAPLAEAGKIIVVCGRRDDAEVWRNLLSAGRCLAIALDDAPPHARARTLRGASDQLAWQHRQIVGLDGSGWLAGLADSFDPANTAALLLPDPLDPPKAGSRRRLGRRHPAWRLFEDKTVVDTLWDTIGIARTKSIVADGTVDWRRLVALVNDGAGVVCCRQPIGDGPSAGGDGISWRRGGSDPAGQSAPPGRYRVRVMPLLEGTPVRLHGIVTAHHVIVFPPMEIIALPRADRGTFFCAGVLPTLGHRTDLVEQATDIGARLGVRLGYRGGFSVDGILTADGFLPTDFNARLTSAMEPAPSALRVQLQLANALARDGHEPDRILVTELAKQCFAAGDVYTLYGAAGRTSVGCPRTVAVRWDGIRLVAAGDVPADGQLVLAPSARGWLLTARLTVARLPAIGLGRLAPQVFRLSDELLGTDFGDLLPPFGLDSTRPRSCGRAGPASPLR